MLWPRPMVAGVRMAGLQPWMVCGCPGGSSLPPQSLLKLRKRAILEAGMSWNVLHLRPRCEKKMAEYCKVHGLDCYLPLREETKIYQRRKVTVQKPLFPGYFFASFDADGRPTLLKSNHIVRILEMRDERQLVYELDQIRQALAVDPGLGTCAALKQGRKVRILAGPFMGVEGVVSGLKGPVKVRLNVDMIGRAVAVEVDRDYLEVVD